MRENLMLIHQAFQVMNVDKLNWMNAGLKLSGMPL
jgi:hypothetical protein